MLFSMRKKIRFLACIALSFSLAGCLIPEKFDASVTVNPDGSYRYAYDGTAVVPLAAAEIRQTGALSAGDENGLKQDAEKVNTSRIEGLRKFAYLGRGQYDISIDRQLQIGQRAEPMDVVSVTRGKDGIITIAPVALQPKDREGLRELGITVHGTVAVTLPKNAQVVYQNADSAPGSLAWMGLGSKAYTWNIGNLDQVPVIKFRLAG
jgi:hypothetical protein